MRLTVSRFAPFASRVSGLRSAAALRLHSTAAAIAIAVLLLAGSRARSEGPVEGLVAGIEEHEAKQTAEEAYIFGYPLVTMELTRRVMTNLAAPEGTRAPMGQFVRARSYPDSKFRDVTAPNADTLYTTAWLDVSKEPWVLSLPDMKDRYYLFPMLDGWTDVFQVPRQLGDRPRGSLGGEKVGGGHRVSGERGRGVSMTPNGVTPIRGSNTAAQWDKSPRAPEDAAFDARSPPRRVRRSRLALRAEVGRMAIARLCHRRRDDARLAQRDPRATPRKSAMRRGRTSAATATAWRARAAS